MGGGKGGKGKGGSEVSVDADVDLDADTDSTMTLDILGLDDIRMSTTSDIDLSSESTSRNEVAVTQPIETRLDSRSELAITEPVVTQMSADLAVDVKPVVLDVCLMLGIKDLPRLRISRPYDKHLGVTVFGVEVFGLNRSGNAQFVIDDLPKKPFVAVGGVASTPRRSERRRRPAVIEAEEHSGGLKIVL